MVNGEVQKCREWYEMSVHASSRRLEGRGEM